MPTSICMTKVAPIRETSSPLTRLPDQRGFTLIEILVALALVALVITLSLPRSGGARAELEQTLDHIERSIRFGVDEAILRNVVVRLHFSLNEDPQHFTIEYGPDAQFVPPPRPEQTRSDLGPSDREAFDEEQQTLNRKFNRIRELSQGKFDISEIIVVMGLGVIEDQNLTLDGEFSLYLFPTGEKDHSFIVLSSDDEFATLEIEPFSMSFRRTFTPHSLDQDLERRYRESNSFFQEWRAAQ
jgi:prepilin-type N-terminal cleavage/methylation domain-containing protein